MNVWVAVLVAGLVSYACRVVALFALGDRTPPPAFQRGAAHVMPAAFAALAAGALVGAFRSGTDVGVPLLLAVLVTVWVTRRSSANRGVLAGVTVLGAGAVVAALH